jgi:hypothetical protein
VGPGEAGAMSYAEKERTTPLQIATACFLVLPLAEQDAAERAARAELGDDADQADVLALAAARHAGLPDPKPRPKSKPTRRAVEENSRTAMAAYRRRGV